MTRLSTLLLPVVVAASSLACPEGASPGGEPRGRSSDERGREAAEEQPPETQSEAVPFEAPADVAEPPPEAKVTESGLAYRVLEPGSGEGQPAPADVVKVHYTGWTTDGKMFDSSRKRGKPASFPLNRVIAGWTEGLQLMTPGAKYRLWIPEELAYKGQPGRPAGMLVFDVELLDVTRAPKVPPDVDGPPENARRTDSGLAYRVLEKGDGKAHPEPTSKVTVHYSGWTTDGEMFDSSVLRGSPATFPLNGVIPGWTEGLQLMTTGAKYRFWIPGELAYDGKPGRPQGTLVFDVELLGIKE